jgi:hypothetical protein
MYQFQSTNISRSTPVKMAGAYIRWVHALDDLRFELEALFDILKPMVIG